MVQLALERAVGFVGDGVFFLVILASDLDARPERVEDGFAHYDQRVIYVFAASNLGSTFEALEES